MNCEPLLLVSGVTKSSAGDPRLAAAAAMLRRALEAAAPEDCAFVLTRLEALARRLAERRVR